MTLPNLITLARIFAVPAILYALFLEAYGVAFALFLAAGVSDALDGFIAKRFDAASELGAWLDPVADKTLLVSVFIMLGMQGHLAVWLVIVVVSRDLLIVGAIVLARLMGVRVEVTPIWSSKVNTALQIILLAVVLFVLGFGVAADEVILMLSLAVTVTTILSGARYLVRWIGSVSAE